MGSQNETPRPPKKLWPLFPTVALFVGLGIVAGVGIFLLLNYFFAGTNNTTYDIVKTSVAVLGVVTVGGAAAIQYRKQRVVETQADTDQETKFSERLTTAIGHLESDKEAVKKGALYEFKRLAIDSPRDREDITSILSSFFREELTSGPEFAEGSIVFMAADVLSFLFDEYECSASLSHLDAKSKTLDRIHLHGADLSHAQLNEIHLQDAWLPDAFLLGANLEGAHLHDVWLQRAQLQYADLQDADLQRANLEGVHLKGVQLEGAQLQFAHLEGAHLQDADLQGANLEGVHLEGVHLEDAHLEDAQLQGAVLEDAWLHGAIFTDADLTGADITGVHNADFTRARGVYQSEDGIWHTKPAFFKLSDI